jgi:hypothetical protein
MERIRGRGTPVIQIHKGNIVHLYSLKSMTLINWDNLSRVLMSKPRSTISTLRRLAHFQVLVPVVTFHHPLFLISPSIIIKCDSINLDNQHFRCSDPHLVIFLYS